MRPHYGLITLDGKQICEWVSPTRRCLEGWRLWAAFGAWEWTKVQDVKFESEFGKIMRELMATNGRMSYFKRLAFADDIYFKTYAKLHHRSDAIRVLRFKDGANSHSVRIPDFG